MIDQLVPPATRLQQNEKDTWPRYYKYVPQVVSLLQQSQWPDPPLMLNLSFARMLSNVGTFLWHTGQFRDCINAMDVAVAAVKGQKDAYRATPECEELLSDIYLVTGILADCIGVSKRRNSMEDRIELMRLREKELDRITPDMRSLEVEIRWGNAKGDLACAHLQREGYEKANQIMKELLGYYKKWGTEQEHPFEYSKYYHHSAFILMAKGYPAKALRYARKGVQLELDHAGSEDAMVLVSEYDLASLLYNAGKLQESLALHKEILQKRRTLCGEGSQFTLGSYEAVAIVAYSLGEYGEAEYVHTFCILMG